eukprot:PhM_4_TR16713/c0_g1_i1/m.34743
MSELQAKRRLKILLRGDQDDPVTHNEISKIYAEYPGLQGDKEPSSRTLPPPVQPAQALDDRTEEQKKFESAQRRLGVLGRAVEDNPNDAEAIAARDTIYSEYPQLKNNSPKKVKKVENTTKWLERATVAIRMYNDVTAHRTTPNSIIIGTIAVGNSIIGTTLSPALVVALALMVGVVQRWWCKQQKHRRSGGDGSCSSSSSSGYAERSIVLILREGVPLLALLMLSQIVVGSLFSLLWVSG